jgi:hypothetical protein
MRDDVNAFRGHHRFEKALLIARYQNSSVQILYMQKLLPTSFKKTWHLMVRSYHTITMSCQPIHNRYPSQRMLSIKSMKNNMLGYHRPTGGLHFQRKRFPVVPIGVEKGKVEEPSVRNSADSPISQFIWAKPFGVKPGSELAIP